MTPTSNELASWASILGATATLLGLIQSVSWLTTIGVCLIALSIFALTQARKGHRLLKSAAINLEGRNLDALNLANLRRRVNRSLIVQRAYHLARIDGQDLIVSWQYDGYCGAEKETSIEFSIDSESNIPFSELECHAFDLQQDPQCLHKIRPVLIGGDGLSKKIAIPFLKALVCKQSFSVILNCKLPGCLSAGVQYYTSTLSFDQPSIHRLAVHLVFARNRPDWVRVYECDAHNQPSLILDLRPLREDEETSEFIDIAENVPGQSARVYVFHIDPPLSPTAPLITMQKRLGSLR
jgi:hypothetical protein